MGNRIQYIIYSVSIIAPFTLALALLWYQQYNTIFVSAILIGISFIFVVMFYFSFSYALRNVETTTVRVTNIIPKFLFYKFPKWSI